jgi:NAD(P)H dehydrogenase (quinone)
MRVLVIHAHPDPESFSHAILAATLDGLTRAGHECTVIDLYGIDYPGGLSRDEWRAYETTNPVIDPIVAEHVELVRRADALVFVYPTWWSSMPAIMKSWLERTMVMGLAFTLDERSRRIRPGLGHLRHLVGISTHGSPRWYVWLINDNGRRTIARTLRLSTGGRARVTWLTLHELDGRSTERRRMFLDQVRRRMERLS